MAETDWPRLPETARETALDCTQLTLVSTKRIIFGHFPAAQIHFTMVRYSVNGAICVDYIGRGPLEASLASLGPAPTPLDIQSPVLTRNARHGLFWYSGQMLQTGTRSPYKGLFGSRSILPFVIHRILQICPMANFRSAAQTCVHLCSAVVVPGWCHMVPHGVSHGA